MAALARRPLVQTLHQIQYKEAVKKTKKTFIVAVSVTTTAIVVWATLFFAGVYFCANGIKATNELTQDSPEESSQILGIMAIIMIFPTAIAAGLCVITSACENRENAKKAELESKLLMEQEQSQHGEVTV